MHKLRNIIKKYIQENMIENVFNFFNVNNIHNLQFIDQSIIPLKLHNKNYAKLGGGNKNKDFSSFIDVYLDKNKYQVRIYKYTEKDDKNYKTINFIKFGSVLQDDGEFSNGEHCAVLIIDTKILESNIQSLNNYADCIKCSDSKNKLYKIGDILIQVMIHMSINKGMKKINLHDNSNYVCNKYSIPLINLRTITKGEQFYCKYGFRPLDHNKNNLNEYQKNELQIYMDNKKLFKSQPKMSKTELLQIIHYTKFDKIKDHNMLNYIEHTLIPRLKEKNNLISEIVNNIIQDSQEKIHIDKSQPTNNNNSFNACRLLKNILMNLYFKCGYYDYIEKTFTLNLKDKKIIEPFQNHIKLKLN